MHPMEIYIVENRLSWKVKVGHSLEEILKLRHRLVSLTTDYRNRQLNQSCNQIYLRSTLTKLAKEMTYV